MPDLDMLEQKLQSIAKLDPRDGLWDQPLTQLLNAFREEQKESPIYWQARYMLVSCYQYVPHDANSLQSACEELLVLLPEHKYLLHAKTKMLLALAFEKQSKLEQAKEIYQSLIDRWADSDRPDLSHLAVQAAISLGDMPWEDKWVRIDYYDQAIKKFKHLADDYVHERMAYTFYQKILMVLQLGDKNLASTVMNELSAHDSQNLAAGWVEKAKKRLALK
jgi:tetratricopeptide (TPR) repeat protein